MSCRPNDDVITSSLIREVMAAAPSRDFGTSESLAVWRGMRDRASTLHRVNRLVEWLRDFFALTPKGPISDPRLEAIRRLTVSLRLNLQSIEWEVASARRAGVAAAQIQALKMRFAAEHREAGIRL